LEQFLEAQIPKIFGPIQPSRYFFAHSVYPEEYVNEFYKSSIQHIIPFLTEKLEEQLKSAGAVRVGSYRYPTEPLHAGTLNPIFPHHVLHYKLLGPTRAEIIWALFPGQVVVGRTFTVTDPNYLQAIDEERPFRRFEGTLPPKYAKALLNFGTQGLKLPPKTRLRLYDPFCGSGTTLLFGVLFEFSVYGSDIDPACVAGTRANLAWYAARDKFPPQDWTAQVLASDANDAQETYSGHTFHAIVSEPILLPYYRRPPPAHQVKADIDAKVVPGYRALFQLAVTLLEPGGRLCCTFPVVDTRERGTVRAFLALRVSIPPSLDELAISSTGIDRGSSGGFLLYEKTENVSREIHLFQKKSNGQE
jgi:SAM-dependent methyltransferase